MCYTGNGNKAAAIMNLPQLDIPTLAVSGSEQRFPVRRIYCVGLNYADHAREMGNDPNRHPPFFFGKPADAIVATGTSWSFPVKTAQLHHEVELVVALGSGGSNISVHDASTLIFGYAVGLDLTRRDLQAEAKKLGRPWDMGKGFDHSAPIGSLTRGVPPAAGSISLTVDGVIRQSGDLREMIWSVDEIISTLSGFVELRGGDLIFTGTPAGVGPILPGQTVRGEIAGTEPIEVSFNA
jgi:fumarylpyruvate hydrolase